MRWQGDRFGFHLRECIVIASSPVSLFKFKLLVREECFIYFFVLS